jgi:hypothetical protein
LNELLVSTANSFTVSRVLSIGGAITRRKRNKNIKLHDFSRFLFEYLSQAVWFKGIITG